MGLVEGETEMRTFEIKLNGNAYSTFVTGLRKPERVLAAFIERMSSLGYRLPDGEWLARPYQRNSLDSYGN